MADLGMYGLITPGCPFNIDSIKSDTVDLPNVTRALIVGVAGNIKLTDAENVTDTYALGAGQWSIRAKRIWSTGTTATGLIGIK